MSTAEVLRLRATSTVSNDKSVRRSAQDDDSGGILAKNIPNKLALIGAGPRSKFWRMRICVGTRHARAFEVTCRRLASFGGAASGPL
jgi:hypothetical protein